MSAQARTTCPSARTASASGSRSARWRPRSSGSTPPTCAHPRIAGRLHPRFPSHSVGFAPDGRTVWLSSARAPYVTVYNAATGRVVKVIRAGRAPAGSRLLGRAGAADERLRLVHRGGAVADVPEVRHRPHALRLVQPRHVRRAGRDLVAAHRPGRPSSGQGRSTASGRRRSRPRRATSRSLSGRASRSRGPRPPSLSSA